MAQSPDQSGTRRADGHGGLSRRRAPPRRSHVEFAPANRQHGRPHARPQQPRSVRRRFRRRSGARSNRSGTCRRLLDAALLRDMARQLAGAHRSGSRQPASACRRRTTRPCRRTRSVARRYSPRWTTSWSRCATARPTNSASAWPISREAVRRPVTSRRWRPIPSRRSLSTPHPSGTDHHRHAARQRTRRRS